MLHANLFAVGYFFPYFQEVNSISKVIQNGTFGNFHSAKRCHVKTFYLNDDSD